MGGQICRISRKESGFRMGDPSGRGKEWVLQSREGSSPPPQTSSVSSGSSSSILQKSFQISPQPHPILRSSLHSGEGSPWPTASTSFSPDLEDQASPLHLGSHLSCFFPSQGTWACACPRFHPGSHKIRNESVNASIS